MKFINIIARFLLAAGVLITIDSCERTRGCTDITATNYNANAQVENNTCQYPVTFYFDLNGANANVVTGGQTSVITANYPNGAPNCGATGCANFVLAAGSYNYTASSATAGWSGTVNVVRGGGCSVVLLQQSTGSVVFWTQLTNAGTITISINGGSGTITSYITGGVPACGFTGCATFDLPPGVYNYTAVSQSGFNWNGSVTITAEGCQPVQFN